MKAELRALGDRLRAAADALGASEGDLPTFGTSDQTGRPHFEVDARGYHYVVCERGTEFERRTSANVEDALFWAVRDIAFSIASKYELAHRVSGPDFRRLLFARELELLQAVNPSWAERQRSEIERILQEHPYADASGR